MGRSGGLRSLEQGAGFEFSSVAGFAPKRRKTCGFERNSRLCGLFCKHCSKSP